MNGDTYDQAIVTSYFAECMDLVHSEIVPGSSGEYMTLPTNAVASTLVSPNGKTWQTNFLQYPLFPMTGDVMDFSRSYFHLDYDLSIGICVGGNTYCDHYIAMGPKSTSGSFSQIQFGMGGNAIFNDMYQFLHSSIQSASVCASESEHSPEYTTIDGLLKNKVSSMRIYCIPKTTLTYKGASEAAALANSFKEYTYTTNYNYSVDLNRLSVLFSNFQYTTTFDGNLTLRLYLMNTLDNFHYMMLPSESSINKSANNANGILTVQNANGILSINPVRWGTAPTSLTIKYVDGDHLCAVDFGTNVEWVPIAAPYAYHAGTAQKFNVTLSDGSGNEGVISVIEDNKSTAETYAAAPANVGFLSIPILFTFNKGNQTNVYQLNYMTLYQYTSKLKDEALQRLHQMFSSTGLIVRPTQQFVTQPFVDGGIGPTTTQSPLPIIQCKFDANNVTHVIISNAPDSQYGNGCLLNTFKTDYTLVANGVPLNNNPYFKVDGRVVKDYTNAIWDTDNEEINNDYLYSLTFPSYVSRTDGKAPGNKQYFVDGDFTEMKNVNFKSSTKTYYKQPNLFFDVFATSAPSSFMTGICVAPTFTSQLVLTLRANYHTSEMADDSRYRPLPMYQNGKVNVSSYNALTLPSYVDRQTTHYATLLKDCVICITYDPNVQHGVSMTIADVYPFADGKQ